MRVNNILVCAWGYEQTNINFYEVLKTSKKCVFVRELKQTQSDFREWSGKTIPQTGEYKGEIFRRTVRMGKTDTYIKINSYQIARLWDGKPRFFSEYA